MLRCTQTRFATFLGERLFQNYAESLAKKNFWLDTHFVRSQFEHVSWEIDEPDSSQIRTFTENDPKAVVDSCAIGSRSIQIYFYLH